MRVRRVTGATILLAAGLLSTAAVSASASSFPAPAPAPQADPHTVVVNCDRQAEVRPGNFLQACADGTLRLTDLRWSQWEPGRATGSGQQVVNDCEPSCVAGQYRTYPVTVTLDNPKPWPGHQGVSHYTRLSVSYLGDKPAMWESLWQQDLWN